MNHFTTPVTSADVDMCGERREFICMGCRRALMLLPGRHWCGCKVVAPFEFYRADSVRVAEMLSKDLAESSRRSLST